VIVKESRERVSKLRLTSRHRVPGSAKAIERARHLLESEWWNLEKHRRRW